MSIPSSKLTDREPGDLQLELRLAVVGLRPLEDDLLLPEQLLVSRRVQRAEHVAFPDRRPLGQQAQDRRGASPGELIPLAADRHPLELALDFRILGTLHPPPRRQRGGQVGATDRGRGDERELLLRSSRRVPSRGIPQHQIATTAGSTRPGRRKKPRLNRGRMIPSYCQSLRPDSARLGGDHDKINEGFVGLYESGAGRVGRQYCITLIRHGNPAPITIPPII